MVTNPDLKLHQPPKLSVRAQLAEPFKDQEAVISTGGQPFLCARNGDHYYNLPINSPAFRAKLLVNQTDGAATPSDADLRAVTRTLTAEAYAGSLAGIPCQMFIRTGWRDNSIILALDTRAVRHIAITHDHWTATQTNTPFVYDPVQQPIPTPIATTHASAILDRFRALLRLDEPNFQILQSWLLTALRPPKDATFHDYPILNLLGPESSGKTTAAKLIATLLDPTGTPIHAMPNTERRLHILASTHHVIAIDSPGKLNPENSRRLSRLAGGIASTYRHFEGMLTRPILLTTRDPHETRHLTSRLVDVEFAPLETPRPQSEIQADFEALRPELLGALLTLLSQQFDHPTPVQPNRKEKNQKIEESVTSLINQQPTGTWKGTATQLVEATGLNLSPAALGRYLKNEDHESFILDGHRKRNARQFTLRISQ